MKQSSHPKFDPLSLLSKKQRRLAKKHGTPPEFAQAVWKCCPGDISADEAHAAVAAYFREWADAE